jgi:heterodisulfide reductase subunit C
MLRLTGHPGEKTFLDQVMRKSGQNLLTCLQCGKCTAGCPVASEEVGGPRQLIAALLLGLKERALKDPTWVYCVSCGTCAGRCPVEINMFAVATALCELAEEEGISPAFPEILLFENLFLKSVRKHGRVRELQTVMAYHLRTLQPFKDLNQGLTLMRKGVFSPFEIVKGRGKNRNAARLFSRVKEIQHGG